MRKRSYLSADWLDPEENLPFPEMSEAPGVEGGGGRGGACLQLGPQSERLAALLSAPTDVSPEGLVRESLRLHPEGADTVIYERQIEDKRREKEFLREQLQRALKQLKAYQLQVSQHPSLQAQVLEEAEQMTDLPDWNMSHAAMTPLVAAYDQRIVELETLTHTQAAKLHSLADQLEVVVAENEDLRRSLVERLEGHQQHEHVQQQGGEPRLLTGDLDRQQRMEELKERSELLMAENAVLVEQTNLTSRELKKATEDVEDRDKQLQAMLQSLRDAGQTVQALEGEAAALRDEKTHCEAQLTQRTADLSHASTALAEHKSALETSQSQVAALSQKLEDSRTTIQTLQQRLEQETDALTSKYQACGRRIRELQAQLLVKTQETEVADERFRKVTRELESTRLDAEGMLKVMSGMQKQLDEYVGREQAVEKTKREIRDQIEEALLERDQAKAREVQTRHELARVLETRRVEADKRLKETQEFLTAAKVKMEQRCERKEQELKDLMMEHARLKVELERVTREKRSTETLYTEVCQSARDEHTSIISRFQDLQQRLIDAEGERADVEMKVQHASREVAKLRQELASNEDNCATMRKQLEHQVKLRERELNSLREMQRRAEAESEVKSRELARLHKRLEELEASWEARVEAVQHARKEEIESYVGKLRKAEGALREQEVVMADHQERQTKLVEKVKKDHKTTVEQVDRALRDEHEMVQRLSLRSQELSSRLAAASSEKAELVLECEASREEVQRLGEALSDHHRRVAELTAQLTEKIGAREAVIKDETRLRAELSRKDLELSALRRGNCHVSSTRD